MDREVTEERLEKYIKLTERALKKVKIFPSISKKDRETAETYKKMASSYLSDSKHFQSEGKLVDAFGAVNYAHAWLDAGAMQKLFDVGGDNKLFTVDPD